MLLLLYPVFRALFLDFLVIEGLLTGFSSCAPIIILLNCAEHISGENSQNFMFSQLVT